MDVQSWAIKRGLPDDISLEQLIEHERVNAGAAGAAAGMAQVIQEHRKKIAQLIVEMLAKRAAGVLKRSADDFISGLVKAYSLVTGIDDLDEALAAATREGSE